MEITQEQKAIVMAVVQEKWPLAMALLLRKTRLGEFRGAKKYSGAIHRVKEEFTSIAHSKPYPEDFTTEDVIHWDGVMAGFVELMGVGLIIKDLKQAAAGKRNLLYFLSTNRGQTPSRWDLMLMRYQEAVRIRQKEKCEKDDADAMKKLSEVLGEFNAKAAEPEWVVKMKKERDIIVGDIADGGRVSDYAKARLKVIRTQLGKWERGELS